MNIDELTAELEKIKGEKYDLLKLINHDIRSPFNRVYALLQLLELESEEVTSRQKEYLDSMYLSVLGGLEMITNLRDMREIDAGNVKMQSFDFDLIKTIKTAVRSFSKQVEIKNQTIHTVMKVEEASVFYDEYYVQRTIENVLSNAVKFSKSGSSITISLIRSENVWQIEIADQAEGIKQEEEHLLYEKYKKLSTTASGGEGCLGLGLYNTAFFLTELNGRIYRKSDNETGNTFVIELPC